MSKIWAGFVIFAPRGPSMWFVLHTPCISNVTGHCGSSTVAVDKLTLKGIGVIASALAASSIWAPLCLYALSGCIVLFCIALYGEILLWKEMVQVGLRPDAAEHRSRDTSSLCEFMLWDMWISPAICGRCDVRRCLVQVCWQNTKQQAMNPKSKFLTWTISCLSLYHVGLLKFIVTFTSSTPCPCFITIISQRPVQAWVPLYRKDVGCSVFLRDCLSKRFWCVPRWWHTLTWGCQA